jgi:hypothetical protein
MNRRGFLTRALLGAAACVLPKTAPAYKIAIDPGAGKCYSARYVRIFDPRTGKHAIYSYKIANSTTISLQERIDSQDHSPLLQGQRCTRGAHQAHDEENARGRARHSHRKAQGSDRNSQNRGAKSGQFRKHGTVKGQHVRKIVIDEISTIG